MSKVTKEDASILLQLMDVMVKDSDFMKSIDWVIYELDVKSYEEFKEKYPKGSKELKYFRDYTSYQELIGVLVLKGLLSEDLIFDLWGNLVWKKLEPIVYGMRKEIEMPRYLENFEVLAKRYPEWAENNPPKV